MNRIISIDVFRALTMVLMIWVNDFWTLKSIPKWLKHAATGEDYLGFSDVIFPWFLFVMGMSIPFAFEDRIKKGESNIAMLTHIVLRSIALLVMGLFHMNMEMYSHETSFFIKPIYVIISTSAFFMIWNMYPKKDQTKQNIFKAIRITGVIILIVMFSLSLKKPAKIFTTNYKYKLTPKITLEKQPEEYKKPPEYVINSKVPNDNYSKNENLDSENFDYVPKRLR